MRKNAGKWRHIVTPVLLSTSLFSGIAHSNMLPLSMAGIPDKFQPGYVPIDTGVLGGGYNTWFDEFSNFSCLNQQSIETFGGSGWVEYGSRLSTEEVKERLEMNVSGSVNVGVFSAGGKGRYLKETQSSGLSLTTHFMFDYTTKNERFVASNQSPLSAAGNSALANNHWNETCGDRFISNRTLGGKLAVALKYNFTSEFFRKEFEASIEGSYGKIGEASASISGLSELAKQNTTLSIVAYQEGGRSYKLSALLGNGDEGTGVFASNSCNLSDVSQCHKLISSVINYAQTTFVEDLKALPSPIHYAYSSYLSAGVKAPIQGALPAKAALQRELLSDAYDKNITDLSDLSYIREFFDPRLTLSQKSALDGAIYNLKYNIQTILEAVDTCYSIDNFGDGSLCASAGSRALSNLMQINNNLKTPPPRIELDNYQLSHAGWGTTTPCYAPTNHVITGYGGRIYKDTITTLHLQVRALQQNGLLGVPFIIKCGNSPDHGLERFVSLPDGYVMTGFGGHVQESNFVGLTAFARKYDPRAVALTGPQISRSSGTTGLEMSYKPSVLSNRIVTGMAMRVYKSNIRGYDAHTSEITKYK